MPPLLLVISSNPSTKTILEKSVSDLNITLQFASTLEEGLHILGQRTSFNCIIFDEHRQSLPLVSMFARFRNVAPLTPIVVVGAEDSARAAVEALQLGAADYLVNPLKQADVHTTLLRMQITAAADQAPATTPSGFDRIVSVSPQMRLVKHLAAEVAATDATVLITGESGTGKELFAHAIHAAGPRSKGPFVALNCAGIPEHLMESELFGYQRGAFTDAKQPKLGRFQAAEGGTLFLDEIGEVSPMAQAKLLRVLEDHVISPLGDTRDIPVDIRVVAATNEDLPAHIKAGKFRLDLYYRLNVYQLRIPPLRERPDDIEPLVRHFLDTIRRDRGRRVPGVSPAAIELLRRHDWPGNVRELHNVVEGLTITCKNPTILPEHLPASFSSTDGRTPRTNGDLPDGQPKPSLLAFGLSLQDMEKKMLMEALHQAGGNISEASRLLKLTRNTLRYRMAKYHLC
ncbi:MAG: Sigma-54 dependent DNA-binding response regulator [Nitrospira sp.]